MQDRFGREITYLRLSVTERCNLRCRYCMPENCKSVTSAAMSRGELRNCVIAAAGLGIKKIRVTGGEPLVRKDIVEICRDAATVDGIEEVCITTNGLLLPQYAKALKDAGVRRVNISLDTLKSEKYSMITNRERLNDAMAGIHAAIDVGFEKIKINCVLIGGFNDDEITEMAMLAKQYPVDVRFIEMMPMYDSGDFGPEAFVSGDRVLKMLPELEEISSDGVAKLYKMPGAKGNIGIISPVSSHFCAACNRLRITADGKIKPCLHSADEYDLKGLDIASMREVLKEAILNKPGEHEPLSYDLRSKTTRNMNRIGG